MKKIELEFLINCSPKLLYTLLSTPTGLAEWFADKVDERHDVFTFHWDGSEEKARMVAMRENEYVKYLWLNGEEDEEHYFEFKITVDDLTNDVALIIVDHCPAGEEKETELLWERQVHDLMHSIGA